VESSDQEDLRGFTLVFEAVTCDDCEETVPVTRSCACGAWTPRDDEHVAKRRPVVATLRAILGAAVTPTTPTDLPSATAALTPWIADLFSGLDLLGSNAADGSALTRQIRALVELRAQIAANGRRRPWLALWDPLVALTDELTRLASTYLDAAIASTPDDAQRLQDIGQGHLDEATRQIGLLSTRLDWWGFEHTIRRPDSIVEAAASAYDTTGAQNLLDLDGRGMPLYQRITGKEVGPAGLGVGLLIDLGLVDRAFDEARVFRVARRIYERLDKHRSTFANLIADPTRQADLLHARRVFYDAQLESETLLRELAGERRLEASAVLELGAKMTERVSGALLNLVVSSDPSVRLKPTADYDDVHAAARKAGLVDALDGFDDRIRNAFAHTDFEVGPDHVLLGRRRARPEKVADEDLVDIVLTAVESCAAIFAAVDCAIRDGGHAAGADPFEDLDVPARVAIMVAVAGAHPGTIEMKADRIEVSAVAYGERSLNPLSLAAIIAGQVPPDAQRLVLRLKRRTGAVVANVALEPLRRFQSDEGLAKDLAFVEFLGRSTLNGRQVFSQRHVRFMVATFVHGLLESPHEQVERSAPMLEATARRLHDRQLLEAVSAFVVMKRAQEGGAPAPLAAKAAFLRLSTFLAKPPGPWNDGSGPTSASA